MPREEETRWARLACCPARLALPNMHFSIFLRLLVGSFRGNSPKIFKCFSRSDMGDDPLSSPRIDELISLTSGNNVRKAVAEDCFHTTQSEDPNRVTREIGNEIKLSRLAGVEIKDQRRWM